MPTYRTPGVYIEEISVFPPSVAEVETAIPAFVGYTEKAMRIVAGDLKNVPTRIKSLLEFESLFGKGPEITVTEALIDEANNFLSTRIATSYYLYDSMRLFFDNGGGICYIVSVSDYGASVGREALKTGVQALKKYDEPTILLFPDAATLGEDDLAAVQQEALKQCGELGDRVAVLDTRDSDALGARFRDRLGINNLKYGAAYSPWLKLNYSKNVGYADVKDKIGKSGTAVTLPSLTSDKDILALIAGIDSVQMDLDGMAARIATATGNANKTVAARQGEFMTQYRSAKTPANAEALFGYLYQLAEVVDGMVAGANPLGNGALRRDIEATIGTALRPAYSTLIALEKELDGKLEGAYTPQWGLDPDPAAAPWRTDPQQADTNIFGNGSPAASTTGIPASADDDTKRLDAAIAGINQAFSTASGVIGGILSGAVAYRSTFEQGLYDSFSVYRNLIKGIDSTLTTCPPSGAIAGVYALVDGQRGVWKAPANVSLNGVIAPTVNFDLDDTNGLNVDAVAGKSINAIRAFSGKGTLVWGARTLAGNDNEWRYISVRRFYNMVEESVKKSTYWAVFEPNDANTWVKVRGMIENYLTQKWREGALAGATTKDAFFVRCGLGVTMNAQDILEGRMIVEIGMAVVRPAEFIILRFSHKLQTS